MSLLEPLFRWKAVEELFSDRARIQGMLDFEAGLARAEARAGIFPKAVAAAIASKCRAELFDIDALAQSADLAGNPAIPVVKQLTSLVGKSDKEAAKFVHWGATSQDAIDTGFLLQQREALGKIAAELGRLADALASLTKKHRATPAAGRTWMQQALPTTFGLRVAGWLDAINRHRLRLAHAQHQTCVLQFGGAVGSLAALGAKGPSVAKALGEELDLKVPDIPWHSHRDRICEVATTLALMTGTLGKIARDISLLMQTEVAEAFEPAAEGRGGSSTLPQKRNPVTAAIVLAAATRVPALASSMLSAMVQEHERGVGGWHAEWETMPEIIGLAAGALHHLSDTVAALEVDAERMLLNLDVTRGLIFAEAVQMELAGAIGLREAHELVEASTKIALKEKQNLREVLARDKAVTKHLRSDQLDRLFDSKQYTGSANEMIDRVLAAHSAMPGRIKSGKTE